MFIKSTFGQEDRNIVWSDEEKKPKLSQFQRKEKKTSQYVSRCISRDQIGLEADLNFILPSFLRRICMG